MKALPYLLLSAAAALFTVGCNLESVDTAGSTSSAAKSASSTTSVDTAATSTPAAKATTPSTTTKSTTTTTKSTPAPAPAAAVANPSSLFVNAGSSLTLRADFAAVARRVDALYNNNHPNTNPGFITATRSGNTWTIPKPLSSYKRGSIPNTWRITLAGRPPAGVTYHTSIMQSFVREGESVTYPPTIRP